MSARATLDRYRPANVVSWFFFIVALVFAVCAFTTLAHQWFITAGLCTVSVIICFTVIRALESDRVKDEHALRNDTSADRPYEPEGDP